MQHTQVHGTKDNAFEMSPVGLKPTTLCCLGRDLYCSSNQGSSASRTEKYSALCTPTIAWVELRNVGGRREKEREIKQYLVSQQFVPQRPRRK